MQEQIYSELDQISVIVFEVNNEEFVIDLLEVKEILQAGQVRRLPKSYEFVEGIYNYRGDIIHIINLNKKLRLDEYKIYQENLDEYEIKEDQNSEEQIEEKVEGKEEGKAEEEKTQDDESINLNELIEMGKKEKKFIIIANVEENVIGFFVDKINNITSIDYSNISGLNPIFQTSLKIKYIRGVIKFKDKPRILIDLSKILSEEELTQLSEEGKSFR